MGTGGQHQLVVGVVPAVLIAHAFLGAIEGHDRGALVVIDGVPGIPVIGVRDEVFARLFAGQQGRQQDAVIAGAGFAAEHAHGIARAPPLDQLFQQPQGGHAIADQDQSLFHPRSSHSARKVISASR